MRGLLVIAGVCVTVIGVGLGFWLARDGRDGDLATRFASYEAASEPNGDLKKVKWPGYVLNAGGDVKRLYEFQITHGELMRYMPCFCGCGHNAGHRSNRDCYVRRVNADGSVVLDAMAPT